MYYKLDATFEYPETADTAAGKIRSSSIKLYSFTRGSDNRKALIKKKRSFLYEFSGAGDVDTFFTDRSLLYGATPAIDVADCKISLICRESDVENIRKILRGGGAYSVKQTAAVKNVRHTS